MSPRQGSQSPTGRTKLKNVALFKEDEETAPDTVPLDNALQSEVYTVLCIKQLSIYLNIAK